jgi:hypothetical protein
MILLNPTELFGILSEKFTRFRSQPFRHDKLQISEYIRPGVGALLALQMHGI